MPERVFQTFEQFEAAWYPIDVAAERYMELRENAEFAKIVGGLGADTRPIEEFDTYHAELLAKGELSAVLERIRFWKHLQYV